MAFVHNDIFPGDFLEMFSIVDRNFVGRHKYIFRASWRREDILEKMEKIRENEKT